MSLPIHLSAPDIGMAEELAVIRAMRSGWIAPLGPEVDLFEAELAAYTQRKHAVALSSGTAALHLALLTLGVGPGDVVLTATMTFAATANAITYTGARPMFVDSDDMGNIEPELLEEAVVDQRRKGQRVAAIVPVDIFGKIASHEAMAQISLRYEVPVVSDAAESLGAVIDGRQSGSFGVAAALSFNGNKVMTTSGGGALVTDDEQLAHRVRYFATQARQPVAHYEHTDIGYNYRLSNVLAALGRAQLIRLDAMLEKRRALRNRYRRLFEDVRGVKLLERTDQFPAAQVGMDGDNCWLTSIIVDPNATRWNNTDLMQHLARASIESRPLWKPMHRQPVFSESASYLNGNSDRLFNTGLSLPSGSSLTNDQIERVLGSLREFLRC